jgi:hypothetical protein
MGEALEEELDQVNLRPWRGNSVIAMSLIHLLNLPIMALFKLPLFLSSSL